MTCHEMTDLLVAYAGDELPPAQREFIELHLEHCALCRGALADLTLTRRQLEVLRAERYQPRLTEPVMKAIRRREAGLTAARWARRGLRLAGAIAAVAAAVFVGRALLPELVPGPAGPGPAPGAFAYVLKGGALVRVDTGRRTQQAVVTGAAGDAQMVTGGGSRFVLTGGELLAIDPTGTVVRRIARVEGRLLGAAPDGRTAWVGRQVDPTRFAIDAVDLFSGTVSPDPEPKPGLIYRGAVSRDGRMLYVTASVQEVTYLKEIETRTRSREEAYRLGAFWSDATPLPAPDGLRVFVAADRTLAVVTLGRREETRAAVIDGLTATAVLGSGGETVLGAHARGGLVEIEPNTLSARRRSRGPVYTHLEWSDDGEWLHAAASDRLDLLTRSGQTIRSIQIQR